MSSLEDLLFYQLTAILQPEVHVAREYRFHPSRRYRADIALPDYRILVECQGGTFMPKGGHNTGVSLRRDYEKCNEAQVLGWKYLQFDREAIETGVAVNVILRAMGYD